MKHIHRRKLHTVPFNYIQILYFNKKKNFKSLSKSKTPKYRSNFWSPAQNLTLLKLDTGVLLKCIQPLSPQYTAQRKECEVFSQSRHCFKEEFLFLSLRSVCIFNIKNKFWLTDGGHGQVKTCFVKCLFKYFCIKASHKWTKWAVPECSVILSFLKWNQL